MPRIPRVRALESLRRAAQFSPSSNSTPFAYASRSISSTPASAAGLREKLWKGGQAPGSSDPYTERPESEESSNIPQEVVNPVDPDSRVYIRNDERVNVPSRHTDTRIALPAGVTEAKTEAELAVEDPTYTPATSFDDLADIPLTTQWWDQPGNWGPESQFNGFGRTERVVDKEVIEVYLRRAVVEVLSLKQAGRWESWALRKWFVGAREELDAALATNIVVDQGVASVEGSVSHITKRLLKGGGNANAPELISTEEAKEMIKAWDPAWKDIPLDLETKFAIRKRLYQLTGSLIPDAKFGATQTVRHILTMASKDPKPKKLAEVLEGRDDFAAMPHVRLHSKKIGPIDREIETGRWKVIKEELEKRDLPVTGTAGIGGHKERKWIRGVE